MTRQEVYKKLYDYHIVLCVTDIEQKHDRRSRYANMYAVKNTWKYFNNQSQIPTMSGL